MAETSEETARLLSDIARSHGLSKVEDWRRIKEGGCPSVGTLLADGRRLVARLFDDESALAWADYMARLAHHLDSTGVDVEQVVPTTSGEPVTLLSGGAPVILSRFYPDPTITVPFDAEDARAWGRYVATLHDACRDWRPPFPIPSPWLHPDPATVLDRSCALAGPFLGPRGILEAASGRIAGCWEGARESRPVHGDLWPGNLLRGPRGLRAIDFAEAGDGPRTSSLREGSDTLVASIRCFSPSTSSRCSATNQSSSRAR